MTKGRVALPFGVMAVMIASLTSFISFPNLPQASQCAPNDQQVGFRFELGAGRVNRRSLHFAHPHFRFRSGRDDNSFVVLTFPTLNLRVVHCSLNLPQASRLLGMTKGGQRFASPLPLFRKQY